MFHWILSSALWAADAASDILPEETFQDLTSSDTMREDLLRMLLSLVAVIALGIISIWFLRRLTQLRLKRGVGSQSIHILEKRMISPKSLLYLIEVEGKKILLAESQVEIRYLQTFSDSHPPVNSASLE